MKEKIHQAVSAEFGVPYDKLYLTKPMFFSKMTNKAAETVHDEYWQVHVDKVTHFQVFPVFIDLELCRFLN